MTEMKTWFSPAELAELQLPDLPSTESGMLRLAKRQRWRELRNAAGEPMARQRRARGGGWEYHYGLLPMRAKAKLVTDHTRAQRAAEAEGEPDEPRAGRASPELWAWFNRLPDARKAKARDRLRIIQAVEALYHGGLQKNVAVATVARRERIAGSTIYLWLRSVKGLDPADRLAALAPRHKGGAAPAECPPAAWEYLKALYLHHSQPSFEHCYRETVRSGAEQGWALPCARTMRRRIEALWRPLVVYLREGPDALKRLYPPLERDRSQLHALEAVNADFHTFDVTVAMPGAEDGARPSLIAIQDLYSNKILAWRVDLHPTSTAVRLAFHDVFEAWGIPDHAVLDNGREFASKLITGGQKTRYRNKIKPEECVGLLTELDVRVHWTLPYSGQSKPIERAFKDFCDTISKHRAFEGAYTGNSPAAKPANYGTRVVPFDTFLQVVARGIDLYNAQEGRRTKVCGGVKSFDQVFAESYDRHPIRKASAEHLQMALMTAQAVKARQPSGELHVLGNRFWAPWLTGYIGHTLTVRYDPDDVRSGIEVFRSDGAYLGAADCWAATGFFDQESARKHGRERRGWLRKTRELAEIERSMGQDEVMRLMAAAAPAPAPESKVVRPLRLAGSAALAAEAMDAAEDEETEMDRNFAASVAELAAFRRRDP